MHTHLHNFREDVICHNSKTGFLSRILGDPYGRLIFSDKWSSEDNSPKPFRFCHPDHKHPVRPIILAGDVNGKMRHVFMNYWHYSNNFLEICHKFTRN